LLLLDKQASTSTSVIAMRIFEQEGSTTAQSGCLLSWLLLLPLQKPDELDFDSDDENCQHFMIVKLN
jgi:hypothetical protein